MLYEEILCLKQINCEFLTTVNQLREENKELKKMVLSLESKLNWREQKNVEQVIEITGVPGVNNNNAAECVQTIFEKALELSVSRDDIQRCYVKRTWKRMANATDGDAKKFNEVFCVHFSSPAVKKKVMKSKRTATKKLNSSLFVEGGNSSIFINDCLTNYTRALFMAAKKRKTENGYKYLWFQNSQVLMRKVDKGRVVAIRSFDDLEALVD